MIWVSSNTLFQSLVETVGTFYILQACNQEYFLKDLENSVSFAHVEIFVELFACTSMLPATFIMIF